MNTKTLTLLNAEFKRRLTRTIAQRQRAAVDRIARAWEKPFSDAANRAFEKDRRAILAIVRAAGEKQLRRKATVNWSALYNDILEYLSGESVENWREIFVPLVKGVVTDQGERWASVLKGVTVGEMGAQFDVQNLFARDWLNQYPLVFAKPVNDTTRDDIAKIIAKAQETGAGIPQIMRQLDETFLAWMGKAPPDDPDWQWFLDRQPANRRELIARTETIRASNAGTHELFKEWGVQRHEWVSTQDDRTRSVERGDEYEHLLDWPQGPNGEVKPINEPFTGTGENMMYPGDPNGDIADYAQCRCTTIPVLEDEL